MRGEQGFETEAVAKFSQRLLRLANTRMSPKLAQRLDAEDIVQSVFKSFFRRHQDHEFEFQHANDIWKLLAAITYRKTMQAARFHQRKQRDFRRENHQDPKGSVPDSPAVDSPTASSLAMMQDLLEHILSRLPESHHQIFLLRLEHFSIDEIAQQARVSSRTVNRTLAQVKLIAEQALGSQT